MASIASKSRSSNVAAKASKHKDGRLQSSKFKQQTLPAWQPIFKGSTALPVFCMIGVIFIPLGIMLLIVSSNVKEFNYDYTHCVSNDSENSTTTCAEFISSRNNTSKLCYCSVTVKLDEFHEPVFVYYSLTNYYQNHRRYVRSRDDDQLHGYAVEPEDLKSECDPFRYMTVNGTYLGYAPCGAIANSLFNDSISITYGENVEIELIRTGIALTADKTIKFNNPSSWTSFIHPPHWHKSVWQLDPDDEDNNGYNNEDLIVWMRTAALPSFRKLYRRMNLIKPPFLGKLLPGNYTINIEYNYPVTIFGGTKCIILSTTSFLGGKNPFLGIAFVVIGAIYIIVGIGLLIVTEHLGDDDIKDNNNVQLVTMYH